MLVDFGAIFNIASKTGCFRQKMATTPSYSYQEIFLETLNIDHTKFKVLINLIWCEIFWQFRYNNMRIFLGLKIVYKNNGVFTRVLLFIEEFVSCDSAFSDFIQTLSISIVQ